MDVHELARTLDPTRTTLLFGAGASIPSGAPSSEQLTRRLANLLSPAPTDVELAEVAQLVENRLTRRALANAVRDTLKDLKPTAGLLALADFDWLSLYTTNFDRLVEQAYEERDRDLDVYRSNFDMMHPRGATTALYKIHGCVSQDSAWGHKSRMLITESDYDEYDQYRQILFNALTQDMYSSDTVIIGQSLKDRHLKELAKKVVGLRGQGVSTRVFLLVHQFDADRAELYSRLGIDVVHATLDTFLLALLDAGKSAQSATHSTSTEAALLTPQLVLTAVDVSHAANLTADPVRLFNGSPASYADIQRGLTVLRVAQTRLRPMLRGARGYFLVVEGARGVGKTTLARALLLELAAANIAAWEHRREAPLDVEAWCNVEAKLRLSGRDGILLVDDCSTSIREVNSLVDRLAALDRSHLRVLITVDAAKWKVSTKSQGFFTRGSSIRLSILEGADLEEMVALLDRRPEIKELVEQDFIALGRRERLSRLRDKCSAEMFVCLKNIFATDGLDDILLQEYASLTAESKDIYRYVAAVQALGGRVHRQLIMRLLGLSATSLDSILAHLEGVVFEKAIDQRLGIYGWETRHDVIAEVIARIKFADQGELEQLFIRLIVGLNPSNRIELETAVALATEPFGIARLTNLDAQVDMHRRLIRAVPAHRTPRRRLIKLFLAHNMLQEANQEIRAFDRAIGPDSVVLRYSAQLTLKRALAGKNLEPEDQLAMLLDAETTARRSGFDLYALLTLGEVGYWQAKLHGRFDAIDDAIDDLVDLEAVNGDPQIPRVRRRLQERLRHLHEGLDIAPTAVAFDEEFVTAEP